MPVILWYTRQKSQLTHCFNSYKFPFMNVPAPPRSLGCCLLHGGGTRMLQCATSSTTSTDCLQFTRWRGFVATTDVSGERSGLNKRILLRDQKFKF